MKWRAPWVSNRWILLPFFLSSLSFLLLQERPSTVRLPTSIMSDTNSTLPLYHGTNFDQKQPTGLSSSTHTLDRTTDLMKPSTFAENNGLFTSKPCRVSISGAIGQYAARINGIYEPTDEMVWELPVYVMVGSNHTRRLEYYFLTKSWQAKATEHKGINIRY